MNGNGELTETENVIFYVSYGVLPVFLRMNVILTYFCNGNGYGNGYGTLEISHGAQRVGSRTSEIPVAGRLLFAETLGARSIINGS